MQTELTDVPHQPTTAQQSDSPRKADNRNGQDPSELSNQTSFNDVNKDFFTNLIS